MGCSAEEVSGVGKYSARATSRVSRSPLSAARHAPTTFEKRDLAPATLLEDLRFQALIDKYAANR